MKPFVRYLALALLLAGPSWSVAQPLSGSGADAGNPYNSPIKRASPNSRQGTQSITPSAPGVNTAPTVRPPTLENGGIRNGYPTRQQAPVPPPDTPRFNPPDRGTPTR
ncbi:hypothetical protein RRX38_22260 [Pseudomonas sp. DTU_2021_1001937_2_SI_NGA_ILE_001]|uniref:hypothetical protein n=1 Tax=Pseudomonas sp. DTU_2021_1001937_2_SI_NGA_ILE_001 TaxID=3077589 RepID=UPI0028FC269F|nr:hypothetical protein [Pseudomonas sp. DTU_2021_1001937_2_SI_NGA_ILE_001]WNW13767.1 hypothetical protein RRX38_22260 [Pseudomonas sp. DTU_2021_1001937_2_SI_NGA_ILE_001]